MATVLTPRFSVVLRSDLPPRERELFEHFCCNITSPAGGHLLHFLCSEVDTSHPFYIEMETFKPSDTQTHPIRIPHHLVMLISGADSRAPIGFLAGGDTG